MNNNMKSKRVISVLLAILMVLTGIPSSFITARAEEQTAKVRFELSDVEVTRLVYDTTIQGYQAGRNIENDDEVELNSAPLAFTVTKNTSVSDGVIHVRSSQDGIAWREEVPNSYENARETYFIYFPPEGNNATFYIEIYVDYRAIQLETAAYSGDPCQILSVEFQGVTNPENAKYDETAQELLYKKIAPAKVTVRTSSQDATVRLKIRKNGEVYVDDHTPREKKGDDFAFTLTPDDKDIEAYIFTEDTDNILYSITADEHITTYYSDNEYHSLSTNWIRASYCPKGSERVGALMAVADKGYTLKSASAETYSGVGLLARAFGFFESYTIKNYDFAAKEGGPILEGGTVTLESTPVADYTATVTYPSDKVEIQLAAQRDGGLSEPLALGADGKVTVSNTERLVLRIKYSDSTAYSVFSTTSDGKKKIPCNIIINNDNVKLEEYCLERMFEDFSVEVTAKARPVVNLKPEHVTFLPVRYQPDKPGVEKYERIDSTINRDHEFTLQDDSPFYFCVDSRCSIGTAEVGTLTGEGGNAVFQPLTPMPDTDPKVVGEHNAVYMVQPGYDEEIVVTDRSTPRTVPIRKWNEGTAIRDIAVRKSSDSFSGDYARVSDNKDFIDVWERVHLEMRLDTVNPEGAGVFAYCVVGKDAEGKEILEMRQWNYDPNTGAFSFDIDEKTREIWYGTRSGVTFEMPGHMQFMLKNYYDDGWRPIGNAFHEMVPTGCPVVFTVNFPDDGKSYYITTTGDESGMLTGTKQENGSWLYSVDMKSDTKISVLEKFPPYELLVDSKSENVAYSVQQNNKITKSEADDNVYFVERSAEGLTFTVTAKTAGIFPGARVFAESGSADGEPIYTPLAVAEVKNTDSSGIISYTYTVDKENLKSNIKIEIFENYGDKEFTVSYAEGSVKSLVLKLDGKEITPYKETPGTADKKAQAVYLVAFGKTLEYSIVSEAGFRICKLSYFEKGQVVNKTVDQDVCSGTMITEEGTYLELDATPVYHWALYRTIRSGNPENVAKLPIPESGDNTFSIIYSTRYEYHLYLYLGNQDISEYVSCASRDKWLSVAPDAQLGGQRITAANNKPAKSSQKSRLTFNGTLPNGTKISQMVTLALASEIDDVTIKMPKAGFLSDTVNVITVKSRNSRQSPASVGYELVMEPGISKNLISADMTVNGKKASVKVSIAANAPEGKIATLKLCRNYLKPDEDNYYLPGGNIDIIVSRPEEYIRKLKPVAAVTDSDDVTLYVALEGTEAIGENLSGAYYYKVAVTPRPLNGEEIPEKIAEAVKEPFYIPKGFDQEAYEDYLEELEDWEEEEDGEEDDDGEEEGEDGPDYIPTAAIRVNNAEYGKGYEYDFDVAVSIILVKDKNVKLTAANEAAVLVASSEERTVSGKTQKASYASKVKLTKKNVELFEGEGYVIAAKLSYEKDALIKKAEAEDITDCKDSEKLQLRVRGDELIVSAPVGALLGKHTVQVVPVGPSTVYKEKSLLEITVLKTITSLKVNVSSSRIYKKNGRKGSLTASVVYNEGDEPPALKRVYFDIVNEYGEDMPYDAAEEELGAPITINYKGNVTVEKHWNDEDYPSSFRIKASAADFEGNEVNALSQLITISSEPLVLGDAIAVKFDPERNLYAVTAQNGATVTSDKLNGARFAVLRNGISVETGDTFTESELGEKTVPGMEYSVKSSSAALKLTVSGGDVYTSVSKAASNLKLTAKAKDGGGKSSVLKVNVKYKTPKEMDLRICKGEDILADADEDKNEVTFKGTINSVLTVQLMEKNEDYTWVPVNAFTNHSLSITNGKILSSDKANGTYRIVVTSDKAKVTFKDKGNNKSKKCGLVNEAYSRKKAAKIKLTSKSAKKIKSGSTTGRSLAYKVSGGYEYCMVEMNTVSAAAKQSAYAAFADACSKIGRCETDEGVINLDFGSGNIPAGNYVMTFTPGNLDEQGDFKAGTKPVKITVSVVKPVVKKGSYKPQTSYKIVAAPGASVNLTGKGSLVKTPAAYTGIYSCSIKGEENKFLEYFVLKDGNVLALREDLTDDQISAMKSNKNDRTGYVTYTVSYGDNGYGEPYAEVTKSVKITINIKK